MLRVLTLVASAGLLLAPAARSADDPKAIVRKAVVAHGGAERLDKYKAGRMKSKGTLVLNGTEIEFTADNVYEMPDKSMNVVQVRVGGNTSKVTQKVHGDKITMTLDGAPQDLNEAQKAEIRQSLYIQKLMQLTPLLREPGFELTTLGPSKADGKDALAVRVSSKGQKDVKLHFDKTTGLLVKVERQGIDPSRQDATAQGVQEMVFSDFREVNGLMRPAKTVAYFEGTKFLTSTATEIQQMEKLDSADFSD